MKYANRKSYQIGGDERRETCFPGNMDMHLADALARIQERAEGLRRELKAQNPECFREQRHTDANTAERVYWHYGYLMALRDVLALLNGSPDFDC